VDLRIWIFLGGNCFHGRFSGSSVFGWKIFRCDECGERFLAEATERYIDRGKWKKGIVVW
jgi:hypothetical protein